MVELATLQMISYIVGYLSVALGVFYYLNNLRETTKNRRATFANNLLSSIFSEDSQRKYFELMSMQWVDFNDFYKKYDSSVNPENYIKRVCFWSLCEHVGWQYRKGLVDLDTIYYSSGQNIQLMWRKFEPIIDEYRKSNIAWGKRALVNWEYLAKALDEMSRSLDPEVHAKWDTIVESSFQKEDVRTG